MKLDWLNIDLQTVLKQLNVTKRGETDGSNNIPAQDDSQSEVENEIASLVTEHYNSQVKKSQETVLLMDKRISDCLGITKSNGHKQLFGNEKQDWNAIKQKYFFDLDNLKEKYDRAVAKLRHFRVSNSILAGREPTVRTNTKLIIACLIPIVMAGIEVGMNIIFLAPHIGPEALPWSLVVSAVNIGFAFYLGRMVITNLMHPVGTSSSKASYIILLTGIVSLIIYVNLFMGIFRALTEKAGLMTGDLVALQAGLEAAMYNALAPWYYLNEINAGSMQLLLIALTFSFFSVIDGYFFDDPINGYGKLGRDHKLAKEKLEDLKDNGPSLIEDFIEDSKKRLRDKRNYRHAHNNDWDDIINDLDTAKKDLFPQFNESIFKTFNDAIDAYRNKNKIFRLTPLPSVMLEPANTQFIKDFTELHRSIEHHILEDGERMKQHGDKALLINEEHDVTVELYTGYFESETQELFNKIRGIEVHD